MNCFFCEKCSKWWKVIVFVSFFIGIIQVSLFILFCVFFSNCFCCFVVLGLLIEMFYVVCLMLVFGGSGIFI